MSEPDWLVSIVLPLYKSERYLRRTLDSVLAQTYRRWELIVVDDGSDDGGAGIGIVRAEDDPRIRTFERHNTGPCRSRNFGIARATGDLIAFIDHDDIWSPEKLEKHVAHLRRRPEVGISYGPSEMIDEAGEPLGLLQVPDKLSGVTYRDILCRNPIGNGSVPLIRREAMEAAKFDATYEDEEEPVYFDEEARHWEDVELWFRIAYQTDWLFEGIPDCLTQYRILPGGVAGNPEKKQHGFELGIERARRYAPDVIGELEGAVRAHHLRYLSRRLIHGGNGPKALRYALRALESHPALIREEPKRTLNTLGAAALLTVLPKPVFEPLKQLAIRLRRAEQDRAIGSS
ncbi:MAG: glycosyltransferase family A protein [Myxococcota bacterium]